MATLTIGISGSAVFTGSKSYTLSDADLQSLLTWAAFAFSRSLPPSPNNAQILIAWINGLLINPTINGVQSFQTPQPVVPAPIGIS